MRVPLKVFVQDLQRLWGERGAAFAFLRRLATDELRQILHAVLVALLRLRHPPLQHWLDLLRTLRCDVQLLKSGQKRNVLIVVLKANSYTAQYPVLGTVQSALHSTPLADLFTQTPSQLLWEASSHMLQLIREGCSYTYPPLSIARYSFIQLSELEQCRVKKRAQGF